MTTEYLYRREGTRRNIYRTRGSHDDEEKNIDHGGSVREKCRHGEKEVVR
jgi:hypothetical protein